MFYVQQRAVRSLQRVQRGRYNPRIIDNEVCPIYDRDTPRLNGTDRMFVRRTGRNWFDKNTWSGLVFPRVNERLFPGRRRRGRAKFSRRRAINAVFYRSANVPGIEERCANYWMILVNSVINDNARATPEKARPGCGDIRKAMKLQEAWPIG